MALSPPSLPNAHPRWLPAGVGAAAGVLLLVSLLLPYWQARLFAPQYRHGLKATMYAHKLAGDIDEIDNLNHYVGVAKMGTLAVLERKVAVPAVVFLAVVCALIPWIKSRPWRWVLAVGVAAYPIGFVADMAYWMHHSATHLNPMAPLKLKPFSIPVIGTGKVGQFRSEVGPMPGFYVALAAVGLIFLVLWLLRERKSSGNLRVGAAGVLVAALFGFPSGLWAASLQERVAATPEGGVLVLPAGIHEGPVVIDRPMTLRGEGEAVIEGGGRGTVVTVRAPGTVLEQLTIRNSGESFLAEDSGVRLEAPQATVRQCVLDNVLFGVYLAKAPDAVVEDNLIRGKDLDVSKRGDLIRLWYSDRVSLRRNRLERGRDAVLWFSNGSVMEDNDIRGGRYGLHFMYTDNCRVAHNRFVGNSVGAYIMYSKQVFLEENRFENNRGPSGAGLGLKESDSVTVVQNVFIGNRQGLFIDQSPVLAENVNRFTHNLFAHNDVGIAILPGAKGDLFAENTFQDNIQQVSVRGGGGLDNTRWEENGRGNYWSDYAGYGAEGAPVGRWPYRVEGTFENVMDKHPLARFFLFTPAAQALEMAGRAFPLFRPKARLTDPFPLLRSPFQSAEKAPPLEASAVSGPMGLLVLAGAGMGLFRRRRGFSSGPSLLKKSASVNPRVGSEILIADSVNKSFGDRRILKDFSLRLLPGESVVLWGHNGAGKSTFLKCALGLVPFEGRLLLGGHDIRTEGHLARRQVGYLPQEFVGYDWTVQEAMDFVCGVRGVDPAKGSPVLSSCGLAGEEGKAVPALSGGMRQKLALAQALIADPPLLMLDEPCSNLDLQSRRDFLDLLKRLKGDRSLLLTSHRREEVESLADRVVWLEEGQPPRSLSPEEFTVALTQNSPVWIQLESESSIPQALDLLRREGFEASPNGHGVWVQPSPRNRMEMVRILERNQCAVKDVRQEERP